MPAGLSQRFPVFFRVNSQRFIQNSCQISKMELFAKMVNG